MKFAGADEQAVKRKAMDTGKSFFNVADFFDQLVKICWLGFRMLLCKPKAMLLVGWRQHCKHGLSLTLKYVKILCQ